MITINIDKAKIVAHAKRRLARSKDFSPYDDVIMKQIPGEDAVQAEVARAAIRVKYAAMQEQIDAATGLDSIKAAAGDALNVE